MRKLAIILVCLTLLPLYPALAEEDFDGFDLALLDGSDGLICYPDDNRIDTVFRPEDQPFPGELSEGQLLTFLDFVELADAGVVVLRFALAVQTFDLLYATEVTLSCGDAVFSRTVAPVTTEYDSIYMEDSYIPVTGEDGFGLIRALLAGGGEMRVTLQGGRTLTGTVHIPTDSLRTVWETYQACGGLRQDLGALR